MHGLFGLPAPASGSVNGGGGDGSRYGIPSSISPRLLPPIIASAISGGGGGGGRAATGRTGVGATGRDAWEGRRRGGGGPALDRRSRVRVGGARGTDVDDCIGCAPDSAAATATATALAPATMAPISSGNNTNSGNEVFHAFLNLGIRLPGRLRRETDGSAEAR